MKCFSDTISFWNQCKNIKQTNFDSWFWLHFFPPEDGGIWAHQLSGLEATGNVSNTWTSFQFSKKLCVGWKESWLPPTDRWALEILPLFLDIFKYLENNIKINDWQNDDYTFQYFHGCTIRTAYEERAESYIIIVGAAKVSTLIKERSHTDDFICSWSSSVILVCLHSITQTDISYVCVQISLI